MAPMSRHAAVAIAVAGLFLANSVGTAGALQYSSAGVQTWSDGRTVTGAYGNSGDLYAYPRPSYGSRVNSVYIKSPSLPDLYGVELGWASNGMDPMLAGATANTGPYLFTARKEAGVYSSHHYTATQFIVGSRRDVQLKARGDDDWDLWIDQSMVGTWWDTGVPYGTPWVGEERSNTAYIDGRASMTDMGYAYKSGGAIYWNHWGFGTTLWSDLDGYRFRWNHIGDPNRWAYSDDHDN